MVHYENMPIQYTDMFSSLKNEIFNRKKNDIVIFCQSIDCGYTLESPRLVDSNEYPQSLLWITKLYHCKHQLYYIKVKIKGHVLHVRVSVMCIHSELH